MAKKLIINCGECDARNVTEETLAAYESIVINSGNVLVTPETRTLLNRYGVTMNSGNVLEIEKDVTVSTVNGPGQIRSGDVVAGKTYTTFNGPLEIGPNTQTVLDGYVGITVNGPLTYPESMSGYIGKIKVNGPLICYPDEAIVLKRNAVIDRLFSLRAKNRLYWSAKRMIMVDPQLDARKLVDKGATFSSKEVILAESKVESLIELIDEKAEIIIVPDGTAVIADDVELDEMLIKRYGTKLYIIGNLKVMTDEEDVLGKLEYLNIRGDAAVIAGLKEKLMAAITEIEGKVNVVRPPKGRQLGDKMSLRISRWLLEQEKDGIHASDCMRITLDEDIPNELILEKLSISDCMEVRCTPEQEAAVAAIAEDVMVIGSLGKTVREAMDGTSDDLGISDMVNGVGDIVKGALGAAKNAVNTKIINAGDYVL